MILLLIAIAEVALFLFAVSPGTMEYGLAFR